MAILILNNFTKALSFHHLKEELNMKKNIDIQHTFQNIKELPLEVSFDEVTTMINQELPSVENTPSHISDFLTIKNFLIMSAFISIIAFFIAFSSNTSYESISHAESVIEQEAPPQVETLQIITSKNKKQIEETALQSKVKTLQKDNFISSTLETKIINGAVLETIIEEQKASQKTEIEKALTIESKKKSNSKKVKKTSTTFEKTAKVKPVEPFITFLVKDFDNQLPLSEVCVKLKKKGVLCGVTDEKGFFFLKEPDFEKYFPMIVVFEKEGYASGEVEITAGGLTTIELVLTGKKVKKDKRKCSKQAVLNFEAELLKDQLIKSEKNYEYKITNRFFKVNGRKLSEATRKKYQNIYENTCSKKLGKFTIKYKRTPNGSQHHISSSGRNL